MKRNASKFLLFVILLLLCGGILFFRFRGSTEAPAAPVPEAASPVLSQDEQIRILEANRSHWAFTEPWDSPWFYTFTDLDHNGRLEVISATTQGSGVYTSAKVWELNAAFTGIEDCRREEPEIEGPDDWPEIVVTALSCYYDRAADRYYYVCENSTRSGFAYQYYQLLVLCLKDGLVSRETLGDKSVDWEAGGDEPLIQCRNAQGEAISAEDYDSAAERRFAGMEQSILTLEWTMVENPMPEETAVNP